MNLAVEAASAAFKGPWRDLTCEQRSDMILRFADLLDKNIEELWKLEAVNTGKPFSSPFGSARSDIEDSIRCWRYFAGLADKVSGRTLSSFGSVSTYTRREPIGVVGLIAPWNYPLMMATWKLAPALACGNTVVFKPSEFTPLTAIFIGDLFNQAGFPPGVVNILTGYG